MEMRVATRGRELGRRNCDRHLHPGRPAGGFAAAVFAAQQARETRRSREAQMAAEFFRRWNEDALVETRRLVARFKSADELSDAFAAYVAADAPEAYVLYRELDYFEQLAALERWGAFDLELIKLLLGRTLV